MPSPLELHVDRIRAPCRVVVLTGQGCPHCRATVDEMRTLARACPAVHLDVADLADAGDLASRFAVRSVPAVILDDELCLGGKVTAIQIAGLLAARAGADFEACRCRALLEHGRVADAAARLGTEEAAAAIAALLAAPELSLRMGAQLSARQAFEHDSASVARLVPKLVALTAATEPAVRGDIADLLGAIGDESVVEPLRHLARYDDNEDVREAAQDALAALEERGVKCS